MLRHPLAGHLLLTVIFLVFALSGANILLMVVSWFVASIIVFSGYLMIGMCRVERH